LYGFFISHACYTISPSHPRLFYDPYSMWRRVQVMRLLIMQSSPVSSHFLPLRSKYCPQHHVLRHPNSKTTVLY
jgi:hypothetical protein